MRIIGRLQNETTLEIMGNSRESQVRIKYWNICINIVLNILTNSNLTNDFPSSVYFFSNLCDYAFRRGLVNTSKVTHKLRYNASHFQDSFRIYPNQVQLNTSSSQFKGSFSLFPRDSRSEGFKSTQLDVLTRAQFNFLGFKIFQTYRFFNFYPIIQNIENLYDF